MNQVLREELLHCTCVIGGEAFQWLVQVPYIHPPLFPAADHKVRARDDHRTRAAKIQVELFQIIIIFWREEIQYGKRYRVKPDEAVAKTSIGPKSRQLVVAIPDKQQHIPLIIDRRSATGLPYTALLAKTGYPGKLQISSVRQDRRSAWSAAHRSE